MRAVKLAISLIRIPRLFAYLFLLPLILSVGVVYVQLIFTRALVAVEKTDSASLEKRINETDDENLVRKFLFGSSSPLPPPKICRWSMQRVEDGRTLELPQSVECRPDRLDVALQVKDPMTFDTAPYEAIFKGNVERIHVCSSCAPDSVIKIGDNSVESRTKSVMGLAVINLARFNKDLRYRYVEAAKGFDQVKALLGDIHLEAAGFKHSINISSLNTSLAILLNLTFLILVTLWLALKAHRKVLDYFARSGALLPMVAATGKGSFYGAIWILTVCRVGAFLFAAVPITLAGLSNFLEEQDLIQFVGDSYSRFAIWLLAIVASLSCATIIASVAELKHRHSLLSFTYRYLPFIVSILGALIWGVTFLFDGHDSVVSIVRAVVASIPIAGIVPVLVGPVFEPPILVLLLHTLLTAALLTFTLRKNARWFAAHLEEI